jgi:hypothetical protein
MLKISKNLQKIKKISLKIPELRNNLQRQKKESGKNRKRRRR